MQVTDDQIRIAENLLIAGNCFDEERRNFIKKLDSCDLLAVPGSGKTTALLAKLCCMNKIQKYSSKSGILVMSHTNDAVEEIKKNLQSKCSELFEYPNFVGTVQDFVDTFLAIPYYNKIFGHSVSRIDAHIYKEEFLKIFQKDWIYNDKVWNFYIKNGENQAPKFNLKVFPDGNVSPWNYDTQKQFEIVPSPPRTWSGHEEENRDHILKNLRRIKQSLLSRGILNFDDCYFIAQQYISESPRIVNILSKRFPFVFVDETQDLQPHQLEIIDCIFNKKDVCLQRIGDENQTIFNNGVKNADCKWIARDVITFNNSMRLTPENASVVDPFILKRAPGQAVNGKRILDNPILPYLIIYDYEHKDVIKEKFIELINQYRLKDTVEGRKYGFHIIGWNSIWNDEKQHIPNELRLCDIFPEFTKNSNIHNSYLESLADYVSTSVQLKNTGQMVKMVYTVICECLRMCNVSEIRKYKGMVINAPYTPSSIKKYIETKETCFVLKFKMDLLQVVKLICVHNKDEVLCKMRNLINDVLTEIGVKNLEALKNFLSTEIVHQSDIEDSHDIDIHFETVHRAKGHTHCATLYVETKYEGDYESIHVLNKVFQNATRKCPIMYFSNPFYKEYNTMNKGVYAQSATKMVYVGLSRPTHLLCYAMHKSSFERYNAEKLHNECGWNIIDLTIM